MASITLDIEPGDQWTEVTRRETDNLPPYVKGTAYWRTSITDPEGGYCVTYQRNEVHIEFINDAWYGLEKRGFTFFTNESQRVQRNNIIGLGWWNPDNPQNPEYLPPACAPTPCSSPESMNTSSSNHSENLSPAEPIEPTNTNTSIDINILTTALTPVISLQGTLPLTSDAPAPVIIPQIAAAILSGQNPSITQQNPIHAPLPSHPMSAAATGTSRGRGGGRGGRGGSTAPGGGAIPPPNSGGLRGIPPAIFSGNCSRSDMFLRKFKCYKRLNRTVDIMSNPFSRVIHTLSYMCGPNIDAWVDAQETALEAKTTCVANPIAETDKVLWNEFETAFKAVWKDTTCTQNAYEQLMKLEMKNGDVDTYIATFERLADAAKWEANAKGTIAHFKVGLQDHIHRRILFRETWPTDMNGWKEAA